MLRVWIALETAWVFGGFMFVRAVGAEMTDARGTSVVLAGTTRMSGGSVCASVERFAAKDGCVRASVDIRRRKDGLACAYFACTRRMDVPRSGDGARWDFEGDWGRCLCRGLWGQEGKLGVAGEIRVVGRVGRSVGCTSTASGT
jgi:hypothetical protein